MDALPTCIDVDETADQLALGVGRKVKVQDKDYMTNHLLILHIPDKIVAGKTDQERDLTSNRDLAYKAGADLGKEEVLKIKFYDSKTCFALQNMTLSCWAFSADTDLLTNVYKLSFDQPDNLLSDFRISSSKLTLFLGFNYHMKIRRYEIRREYDESEPKPGPVHLNYDAEWQKAAFYFKEGNLAGLDDWFWKVLFNCDSERPQVFIDGQLTDPSTLRALLMDDWSMPHCGPKIKWHYKPDLGLFAATARLMDTPARMLTFRSRRSTRWDCHMVNLAFSLDKLNPHAKLFPELDVFPDPDNKDNYRVLLAVGASIKCYHITDTTVTEFFHHDGHVSNVVKLCHYPSNPDVVFSADEGMNVHIWWPNKKTTIRMNTM